MEKLELLYGDEYSPRKIELLAIIGEAYLGLGTPDEKFYKQRINQALDELDSEEEADKEMNEGLFKFL